jgi:pimeloyl-ACP methyl ester carboxylesterase
MRRRAKRERPGAQPMSAAPTGDGLQVPVSGGTLAAFALAGADPRTPAVLAIHGITANGQAWLAVARALGGQARLVAVDLRGRGASRALPAPYGIAAHAQDMLAVLDRHELERTVVVGHSLGAYIATRLAVEHPERVRALVLVDGGLKIPGTEEVDPQEFLDAFLGPALARLKLSFATREDYHDWWHAHPALTTGDVAAADLDAYADHDLVGSEPQLRSGVAEPAVRADAADLFTITDASQRLRVPATLMCAPRGLVDDPNPMQPAQLVRAWVAGAPRERRMVAVADVNHYTIVMGRRGADAVAQAVLAALVP